MFERTQACPQARADDCGSRATIGYVLLFFF